MHKLGLTALLFLAIFAATDSAAAPAQKSFIIAVKQLHPDGESHAITCAEGATTCIIEMQLASAKIDRVTIGVFISDGVAHVGFKNGTRLLLGDHQPYLTASLGKSSTYKVNLDYPMAGETGGAYQLPVLRYSYNPLASLEITVVPTSLRQ